MRNVVLSVSINYFYYFCTVRLGDGISECKGSGQRVVQSGDHPAGHCVRQERSEWRHIQVCCHFQIRQR